MRPLLSIIGIICEAFGKLCPEQYSVYFAEMWIEIVDFVSDSPPTLCLVSELPRHPT